LSVFHLVDWRGLLEIGQRIGIVGDVLTVRR